MPNASGLIRAQLEQIERWQFEGHALKDIYQRLRAQSGTYFGFNAFVVGLYRARKNRRLQMQTVDAADKNITQTSTAHLATSQKQLVKQVRQIFKDGTDVSEFLT